MYEHRCFEQQQASDQLRQENHELMMRCKQLQENFNIELSSQKQQNEQMSNYL